MRIALAPHEVRLAEAVAAARSGKAIEKDRPAMYGCRQEDRLPIDRLGAAGELAAALAYGLPWTGVYFRDLGRRKPADIGERTEVRTRPCASYGIEPAALLIHPGDRDEWCAVLVIAATWPDFEVVGSINVGRAKRAEWWRDPARGRPCYFVPQSELTPPAERVYC